MDECGDGQTKVQLLEEAIRLADFDGEARLQVWLRRYLIDVCHDTAMTDKQLVALSWCMQAVDRDPNVVPDTETFLSEYAEMAVRASDVSCVSWEQIDQLLTDALERSQRLGYRGRMAMHCRWRTEMRLAKFDKALVSYEKWKRMPREAMCFPVAADLDSECELLVRMNRSEEAMVKARPILDGQMKLGTAVPGNTYGELLLAAMRLGNRELAQEFQAAGWPFHQTNGGGIYYLARHLLYFAWTGQLECTLPILEQSLCTAFETVNVDNKWGFWASCDVVLRCLARDRTRGKFPLPTAHPLYCESGEYELQELQDWFATECDLIGDAFDERNGNTERRRLHAEMQTLCNVQ